MLAMAMVALSWFVTRIAKDAAQTVFGWAGIVFFGAALLAIILSALRGGTAVVFDGSGITDERMNIGIIPWQEIEACRVATVQSSKFLCLSLREPEPYLSRLSRWRRLQSNSNQRLGFGHLAISFSGLQPGLNEAIEYLNQHRPGLLASA